MYLYTINNEILHLEIITFLNVLIALMIHADGDLGREFKIVLLWAKQGTMEIILFKDEYST